MVKGTFFYFGKLFFYEDEDENEDTQNVAIISRK